MMGLSNYPAGITGNEPEIAGYPEDEDGNPIEEEEDDSWQNWDARYDYDTAREG